MLTVKPKNGTSNYGAPQCMHIKFNGQQCLQPAMRNKKFCHFHGFLHERNQMPDGERFRIPIAEDTASIQIAIIQVMRALVCNHIDTKKAGVLLYGLQLCSTNLLVDREVFAVHLQPPQGQKEEPPSLAQILLERLGVQAPDAVPEEEHQPPFHKPHPNPALTAPPPAGTSRKPPEIETDQSSTSAVVKMNGG